MKNIKTLIEAKEELQKRVLNIIGYDSGNNSPIERCGDKWTIMDGELYLYEEDGDPDDDYYLYTISSYSAKGEKLYVGEEDGLTFVMAHPEDSQYDDTTIFVLENKNRYEPSDDDE